MLEPEYYRCWSLTDYNGVVLLAIGRGTSVAIVDPGRLAEHIPAISLPDGKNAIEVSWEPPCARTGKHSGNLLCLSSDCSLILYER